MTAGTKSFIFELIREKFDLIFWDFEYHDTGAKDLIKATLELDLIEQAKEMISDAKDYGYNYTNLLN